MAIKYGSSMTIEPIKRQEFGFPQPKKEMEHPWWEGWITALRVLLTVAEIAIAFTGVGVLADIGVGLAFGAVNQILDEATGSANLTGTLLNFGSPFIGGGFTGLANLKQAVRFEKGITSAVKAAEKVGTKLPSGTTELLESVGKFSKTQMFNSGLKNYTKVAINEYKTGLKAAKGAEAEIMFNTFSKDIKNTIRENISGFANLGKTLSVGSDNIARETFEDVNFQRTIRALVSSDEDFELLMSILRTARTYSDVRKILFAYVNSLDEIGGKQFIRALKGQIDEMSKSVIEISEEHFKSIIEFNNTLSNALGGTLKRIERDESTWGRIIKFMNKNRYRITQGIQMIDPNDFGRAIAENIYKGLNKTMKKAFKSLKGVNDFVEAFEKNGGVSVVSQWHIGYKIIQNFGINKLVQITYMRDKLGLRYRHVLVIATDRQLKLYEQSPGRFYRNTWALSNGRKVDLTSLISFGNGSIASKQKIASVLGFIPVPALRDLLSVTSNLVENISDIVDGSYGKNWAKSFQKSLVNSSISRSFRLATNAMGETGMHMFKSKIAKYVARELQRVNTNVIIKGIKRKMAHKSFMAPNPGSQMLRLVSLSSRTHGLKQLRKRGGGVPSMLTARRKLEMIKRIPNAVTVGRPFKGFKYR